VRALVLLSLCGCAAESFPEDFGIPDLTGYDAPVLDLTPVEAGPPDLSLRPINVVYVSGYSAQIARFLLDSSTGMLTAMGTTPVSGNPSFLAVDPVGRQLYAVDEASPGLVRAFSIDQRTGALTPLGATVASGGNGPAHLSVDPLGRWLLVANYGDGTVTVIRLNPDGSLGAQSDNKLAGANAHQILADENDMHVFVPCKGADYTAQYLFDAFSGKLTPNGPATAPASAPGAGPRHLALRPGFAWLIEENSSTMTAYTRDNFGRLTFLQSLSTVPTGTSGNAAAEVVLSGNFLYGSNRGHDSIVQFSLDATGRMTQVGFTKTGGKTPRSFTIFDRWLLVANQDSNEVRVMSLDPLSGVPTLTSVQVAVPTPAFVGVVSLSGT
jgi:6-phosphogluconolactonase